MTKDKKVEVLKVSRTSSPNVVAGAICNVVNRGDTCDLVAIGSGPINQAVKAIIVANRFLASSGMSVACKPSFLTLNLPAGKDGTKEITAIRFRIVVEE